MSRTLFITGPSAGIGLGLTRAWLERGGTVYGISRSRPPLESGRLHWAAADLGSQAPPDGLLRELLGDVRPDLAVLNSGIFGRIADLRDTSQADLESVFQVNLWGCKRTIDALMALPAPPRQVVAISSGAAVTGYRGWGAYALSKAALNMLVQVYAAEHPAVHFSALAPGLVHTAMQDLLHHEPVEHSPVLQRLRQARGTPQMPSPEQVAPRLLVAMDRLLGEASGCFRDLRALDDTL
jgi:benzil reductase ((S)-benzoin forming)